MTALEIVRSFAKEHDLKPLAGIAKNVYQLDYEDRQFNIFVTPSRPKQLWARGHQGGIWPWRAHVPFR